MAARWHGQGARRGAAGRIRRFLAGGAEFLQAEVDDVLEPEERGIEIQALMRQVQTTFETYVKLNKRIPPEMLISTQTIEDPSRLSDTIVKISLALLLDKQTILETESPQKRLSACTELMQAETEIPC